MAASIKLPTKIASAEKLTHSVNKLLWLRIILLCLHIWVDDQWQRVETGGIHVLTEARVTQPSSRSIKPIKFTLYYTVFVNSTWQRWWWVLVNVKQYSRVLAITNTIDSLPSYHACIFIRFPNSWNCVLLLSTVIRIIHFFTRAKFAVISVVVIIQIGLLPWQERHIPGGN